MFKKAALFLSIALFLNTLQLINNVSYATSVYSEKTLIRAVQDNDYGLTRYLLKVGVNVNTYTNTGLTPLMIAVSNDNASMAELLLRYGADINEMDYYGNSAYCYSITSGNKDMQSFLKRSGAKSYEKCNTRNVAGNKTKNKPSHFLKNAGLTVLTVGVVAAAAGGGGGGGSGSEGGSGDSSSEDGGLAPSDFETEEYSRAKLDLVNASSMYASGYAGKYVSGDFNGESVKVAIIDSGTDIDHISLVNNISTELSGTDITGSDDNPSPNFSSNFHGTHVAGIIVATKDDANMHGIAYEAEIIPYKVATADEEYVNTSYAALALNDIVSKNSAFAADGKGKIIAVNNSYGAPTIDESGNKINLDASDITEGQFIATPSGNSLVNAIGNALDAGIITVWAAGNDSDANSGIIAAQPSYNSGVAKGFYKDEASLGEDEINPADLNVVAIAANEDGTDIANYSNRCGVMQNYCIMAPGTGVYSTKPNDTYGSASGTSMAAPMVTGAIALVKGAAPNLTGDKILEILFTTATDMGEAGVDEIYGWGMMNLQAALSPIGSLSIASVSSVSTKSSSSSLNSSKIFTTSSMGSLLSSLNQKIITLDSYERSYEADIAELTSVEEKTNSISYLNSFMKSNKTITERVNIDKYTSLNLTKNNLVSSEEVDKNMYRFNFSLEHKLKNTKNKSISAYYSQDNILPTIENDIVLNNNFISKINNPYISFINNVDGFIEECDENQITNTGFGFNLSKNFNVVLNNNKISKEISTDNIQNFTNQTILTSLKHDIKNTELDFINGITKENDTVLGSYFGGAFNGIEESVTNFHGLGFKHKVSNNINLFGNYMIGFTNTKISYNDADMLLGNMSNIRSDTFAFGVVYNDIKAEKELGFKISQPLRISDGSMVFVLPQERDYDSETIKSNTYKIGMTPSGREIDIEGYYKFNMFKNLETKLGLMHILDKNHDSNSEVETIGMIGFRKLF